MSLNLPKVSFVIIGHNEAAKIAECITSIFRLDYPENLKEIIYVDNFSTDQSVAEAARFPIRILALQKDPPRPGLARNAGLAIATGELVQFVDGDMEMDAQWLQHAVPLFQESRVGCVVGRLQEEHPQATRYNAVLDFSWKLKSLGAVEAPSGGGLFRRELAVQVKGYDETMRAGEEIDLGYKLRYAGFEIHSIPAVMARHDADLRGFRQMWRRSLRDGYGEMQVILKHWNASQSWPQDYVWKMNAQVGLFLLCAVLIACAQQWLWLLPLGAAPLLLIARKTWRYGRQTGTWRVSFWYSFFLYFLMIPLVLGELRCLWDRARTRLHSQRTRCAKWQFVVAPSGAPKH